MRAAPVVLIVAVAAAFGTADARPRKKQPSDVVDISAAKSQLKVLTDSDGAIYVIDSSWRDDQMVFFGDKKNVYRLRIFGGGADGKAFSLRFWSPRVDHQADVGRKDTGDFFVRCGDDEELLKPLPDGDARQVLDKAGFHTSLWKRQGHFLARDDSGTYYYVDRLRDEAGGKGYRVFVGPAGAMKEQPMKNVVSDSIGQIFSTKNGQLRMVTSNSEVTWIKGKDKSSLTPVPVEDNIKLVYDELGVYPGGLGTPCDGG
ncbi:MAG: hypothetical protein R3B06_06980 [Kofleriaceae bacterium]